MPKPMAAGGIGAAVELREEGGDEVDCEKQLPDRDEVDCEKQLPDRDEDDEDLDTLLARLRADWTGESRRSLGRPDRSWAVTRVSRMKMARRDTDHLRL